MEQASRQTLVEAYAERSFRDVAKPSETEIADYYNQHPELFSQRRIYRIQELELTLEPSRLAEVDARLKSSHSMGDFVNWVKEQGIEGKTAVVVKPAEQIPAPLLDSLSQMKDGEVTILPGRPGHVLIQQLQESQLQPVSLEQAKNAIEQALTAPETQGNDGSGPEKAARSGQDRIRKRLCAGCRSKRRRQTWPTECSNDSRDRRCRFHRRQFRSGLAGASDEAVVNLDKLTYAGNLENLRSLQGDARHVFVQGDIGDRATVDALLQQYRPRAMVNFAAESHVDRSIHGPASSSRPMWSAPSSCWKRCAHIGAAAGGRAGGVPLPARVDRRGVRLARPHRSAVFRNHAVRAEQPVLGVEGRVRPSGARLPPHLRPAGADHQLLEQLRAATVSGKAHSADDPQRAGGQAAADLRRRQQRSRLAVRRRPLQRDPAGAGSRAGGGDLQHRRLQREDQSRGGEDAVRHPRRTAPRFARHRRTPA